MSFDFIRLFADTSNTPLGHAALEYAKSLCRIAPVRVVSMSGSGFDGPWEAYHELSLTPMQGSFVNCVCIHPSLWKRPLSFAASAGMFAADGGVIEDGGVIQHNNLADIITGEITLWTAGVRNVLFVVVPPTTDAELAEVSRYDEFMQWLGEPGDYGPAFHRRVRFTVLGGYV